MVSSPPAPGDPGWPVFGLEPVLAWMNEVMQTFKDGQQQAVRACNGPFMDNVEDCLDNVFKILTHRRFTHLGREAASRYRSMIVSNLRRDVAREQAFQFFFDLGPGYHASIHPDFSGLRFEPGLAELLALRQIALFSKKVETVYPPGVKFWIVVDDLCAWISNEIPLSRTSSYLKRFEEMVATLGMSHLIGLLPESAVIDAESYRQAVVEEPELSESMTLNPSRADIENVSRFVGRPCTHDEAVKLIRRYARAQIVSARMMASHLEGVRLMQRGSSEAFGFRSYPGGDARHQCGEIDLLVSHDARPRPLLTTHRNFDRFNRWPMPAEHLPDQWPLKPDVFHLVCTTWKT